MLVVVMGVSGSGKSTIAQALADRLHVGFCEGDDLHPRANIARMAAGHPLTDADRWPWLDRINHWLHAHQHLGGVVSCSALRRSYRDRLRRNLQPSPTFVLLDPSPAILERRLATRRHPFMPATLLDSQPATLERPTADEAAIVMTGEAEARTVVDRIVDQLGG